MDIDSRTLAQELRIAFARFAQGLPCSLSLFPSPALLACRSALGLLVGGFVFCSLLQHHRVILVRLAVRGFGWRRFCNCWRGRGPRGCGVLLSRLGWLLFLFLLFRLLLDA